jgi:hypothetical protein
MAIGPINTSSAAAAAAAARVEPVTEANVVRQVLGRLAAIAKSTLDAPTPQPALSPEAQMARSVAAAVQQAAPRQGGLAPLMADLKQTLAALPPNVQAAALRVLAQATPLGPNVTPAELKAAVARSGLFLEVHMAAAAQAPTNAPAPPPLDLKAALLIAREALSQWVKAAAPAPEGAAPTSRQGGPPPPPPLRGAPTAAQPPASPTLPPDAPAALAAGRLLQETDAALARQELLQAASLPEALQPGPNRTGVSGPHWLFEIPFTGPHGQGVAQFEVEAEGEGEARSWARAWRARFSLDIEPFGPLHAQLSLIGRKAGVALWAERPESAARFGEWRSEIVEALEAADYLADVAVMTGAPPVRSAPPAGALVDRSS